MGMELPLELEFAPGRVAVEPTYVVVLKNLKGERDALSRAVPAVFEGLLPLIESPGRRGKVGLRIRVDTLRRWMTAIKKSLPDGQPVLLDFPTLTARHVTSGLSAEQHALAYLFEYARREGVNAAPVIRVGETAEKIRLLGGVAAEFPENACLRYRWRTLPGPGISRSDVIGRALKEAGLTPKQCHLVVDMERIDDDLELSGSEVAAQLGKLPAISDWISLSLVATAMPTALGCIREGTLGSIPRREWKLWRDVCKARPARAPVFGDYGIQGPKDPQLKTGPGMRANIRYTTNEETLIARGRGSVIIEGPEQYRELCRWLVDSQSFSGRDFSWGDEVIHECARGGPLSAGQGVWRGAGTSHHLAFVARQLRQGEQAAA